MAMGSFEWMEVEALSGEIAALDARLAQAKARHNHGLVKVLREEIASAQQRRAKYLANISTSLANSLEPPAPPPKAVAEEKPAPKGREKVAEPEPEPEVAAEEVAEPEADTAEEVVAEAAEETAAADEPEAETAEVVAEAEEAEAEEPEPEAVAETADEPAVAPVEEVVEKAKEPAEAELEEVAAAPEPQAAAPVAKGRAQSPGADAIEGVNAVWNQLSVADIDKAKRQLDIRRAEMLARHAEELKALEADQAQIDTLAQAIDAFVRKFNAPADDGSVVRLDEKRAS